MKLFLLLLVLSTSIFAQSVQTLMVTTNDNDNLVAHLKVQLDDKSDLFKFVEEAFKGSQQVKQSVHNAQALQSGIVLHREKGRDIILLKSVHLSEANGGMVELKYLVNGITGSWESLELDLRRDGDLWSLYYRGKKISKANIKVNRKLLVGVVGIRTIQFN